MNLKDLITAYHCTANQSVPDWMTGAFKRRSISYANGTTDTDTHVFWLQGRNITIDLRLPIEAEQIAFKPLNQYTPEELRALSNYEGWSADSVWSNEQLSWTGGTSFQIHNRWPEAADLKRVGDCMIEFAPSGAYVEDWRLLSRSAGPLVGLKLIEEVDIESGQVNHRDGALIINGDWAAMVLGRPGALNVESDLKNNPETRDGPQRHMDETKQLRDFLPQALENQALISSMFQFETSIAQGDMEKGFRISYSTRHERIGEHLFDLEGFEYCQEKNQIIQRCYKKGRLVLRRFSIDSMEPTFNYTASTTQTHTAKDWFQYENQTIGRYLKQRVL